MTQSYRRVAITGLGLLSPLGNSPDVFFNQLIAGNSGIGHITSGFSELLDTKIVAQVKFDATQHFTKQELSILDRVSQFSVFVAKQALQDANLTLTPEVLPRTGVYLGTGMGGAQSVEDGYVRLFKEEANRLKPFTVLMAMNGAAGSQIGLHLGLKGPNLTFSTACSSSSVAIGEAFRQIRHGYADIMLAGGSEALLTLGTIKAWEALRTLAQEDTQDPSASCKPFSLDRTGLVLGEGAGMVVLEDMDRAKTRGARIYGEIVGYGATNDSFHITQPSVEGQASAMAAALKSANINANKIGYINAHGTGTVLNDATETASIKQVFGMHTPVSSTKSMHGHLMGAAGAVEFIATTLALENGVLPPTINLKNVDPACDLDYVPNEARQSPEMTHVMSNSFAFGGTCAVLIIAKVTD